MTLQIGDPDDPAHAIVETVESNCVINCAGLYADEVAEMLGNRNYRIYPVRGEYCEMVRAKSYLVNNLVYPVPHAHGLGLGVHLTKTLWGTVLVGPTADYVEDKNDYERNRLPVEEFARSAKTMVPELEVEDLKLAFSGIRPKLVAPGTNGFADFAIARDAEAPRAIHLVGIESPGLTSCLTIAGHVAPRSRKPSIESQGCTCPVNQDLWPGEPEISGIRLARFTICLIWTQAPIGRRDGAADRKRDCGESLLLGYSHAVELVAQRVHDVDGDQ